MVPIKKIRSPLYQNHKNISFIFNLTLGKEVNIHLCINIYLKLNFSVYKNYTFSVSILHCIHVD